MTLGRKLAAALVGFVVVGGTAGSIAATHSLSPWPTAAGSTQISRSADSPDPADPADQPETPEVGD